MRSPCNANYMLSIKPFYRQLCVFIMLRDKRSKLPTHKVRHSAAASRKDTGEASNQGALFSGTSWGRRCLLRRRRCLSVSLVQPEALGTPGPRAAASSWVQPSPGRISVAPRAAPMAAAPKPSPPKSPGPAPCPVLVPPGSPRQAQALAGNYLERKHMKGEPREWGKWPGK